MLTFFAPTTKWQAIFSAIFLIFRRLFINIANINKNKYNVTVVTVVNVCMIIIIAKYYVCSCVALLRLTFIGFILLSLSDISFLLILLLCFVYGTVGMLPAKCFQISLFISIPLIL